MLPDMSAVLDDWERPHRIKTVSVVKNPDLTETETVIGRTQHCVVQVADKAKLNTDTIDWSLEYLLIHSKTPIDIDELIEYKGEDFKVFSKGPWRDYGFTEVIAEQTKRPLVEETE